MLKSLVSFEENTTLIMDSGVQCLDFGLTLDVKKIPIGEFLRSESNRSLLRLEYDEEQDIYFHPSKPRLAARSALAMAVDESIDLLEGIWLPIPYYRFTAPSSFTEGPMNWARMRIVTLPEPDEDGHTHRITVAFDTRIDKPESAAAYLAPNIDDVQAGATFKLGYRADQIGFFLEAAWIDEWLNEVFSKRAAQKQKLASDEVEELLAELNHHAHYLNLLHLLGHYAAPPKIQILTNRRPDAIPVDLVLDVGNSRTCGILIERHKQSEDGLKSRYELELRDLSQPEICYNRPFESRIEFARADFGLEQYSIKSGRYDAFLWPTIARVGPEATRLASTRRGNEGSTGLSSPKRYLWDEEPYASGWKFNSSNSGSGEELLATAAPFTNYVNETGEALYQLPIHERIPVFNPRYSRSSLMMFMLAEVFAQAIVQINSVSQRQRQTHANIPRVLKSIILTVPPSMPKPEREIFRERAQQAIHLLWKALRWHEADADPDNDDSPAEPAFPTINVEWDEASCGQVVYLYSEVQSNFGGHPEEFFKVMRRSGHKETDRRITIGSIDIGGGTTDLVIADYYLDDGKGANVYIHPQQRFRDGFKVAGDDILLDVINELLIPPIGQALEAAGISDAAPILSRLIGAEAVDAREATLRQQFALQVLYPAGLRLLREYEAYSPLDAPDVETLTIRQLLEDASPPTENMVQYFWDAVRREIGPDKPFFDVLDVSVPVDLPRLHGCFLGSKFDISKTIRSLGEIANLYNCDVLLLTGRPSRLPGIQSLLKMLVPIPPNRIIPLQNYRTGVWYPFHRLGRIDDPKTTAAVGAALCVQAGHGRLPNFFFRSDDFQPYSTLRYLGMMDDNGIIKSEDVYYSDINLDDPDYELSEAAFEMRGTMRLGFRQLEAQRWGAAPLYTLTFADDELSNKIFGNVLKVRLKSESRRRKGSNDRLAIASVTSDTISVNAKAVKLTLNTLANVGAGETSYWLDSGSVYR